MNYYKLGFQKESFVKDYWEALFKMNKKKLPFVNFGFETKKKPCGYPSQVGEEHGLLLWRHPQRHARFPFSIHYQYEALCLNRRVRWSMPTFAHPYFFAVVSLTHLVPTLVSEFLNVRRFPVRVIAHSQAGLWLVAPVSSAEAWAEWRKFLPSRNWAGKLFDAEVWASWWEHNLDVI